MRKFVIAFLCITSVFLYAQGSSSEGILHVAKPSSVVAQPYLIRLALVPEALENTHGIGIEAHLELFGLNLSVGTIGSTKGFTEFTLGRPIYLGAGISFGGLFLAFSSNVPSLEQITQLDAYEIPVVSAGIASYKKTFFLFPSWSRVEISYTNAKILTKDQSGKLIINDQVDLLDASANFRIEDNSLGYFLFRFTVPNIKEVVNGEFNYTWELALPAQLFYIYVGQPYSCDWVVGLGFATNFFNTLGKYNLQSGEFSWIVSAQM
ncbi:hypothetical protein [Fervidobacterium islandicum]|uniref:hypothetical protein n=1 Tax=Fervidobacterium islandicum TaxID=2423 RepID=UPI003A6B6F64